MCTKSTTEAIHGSTISPCSRYPREVPIIHERALLALFEVLDRSIQVRQLKEAYTEEFSFQIQNEFNFTKLVGPVTLPKQNLIVKAGAKAVVSGYGRLWVSLWSCKILISSSDYKSEHPDHWDQVFRENQNSDLTTSRLSLAAQRQQNHGAECGDHPNSEWQVLQVHVQEEWEDYLPHAHLRERAYCGERFMQGKSFMRCIVHRSRLAQRLNAVQCQRSVNRSGRFVLLLLRTSLRLSIGISDCFWCLYTRALIPYCVTRS